MFEWTQYYLQDLIGQKFKPLQNVVTVKQVTIGFAVNIKA